MKNWTPWLRWCARWWCLQSVARAFLLSLLLQLFMVHVWNADIEDKLRKVTRNSCPVSSEGSSPALGRRRFWSSHRALTRTHAPGKTVCASRPPGPLFPFVMEAELLANVLSSSIYLWIIHTCRLHVLVDSTTPYFPCYWNTVLCCQASVVGRATVPKEKLRLSKCASLSHTDALLILFV